MVTPISLTIQPPRSACCQPLTCKPLPGEWKICYVANKTRELIGVTLNKTLEWTARAVLFACQSAFALAGIILTTPIAILQILFKAIFSPSRLTNYTIGKAGEPLTQKHLSRTLQALANRGSGVENLTIQHGTSSQPVECDQSLIAHLGLLKLQSLRFVGCQISEELERKLDSVLDLKEVIQTSPHGALWVKQQRIPESTITINSRDELISAIQNLSQTEKRISVLHIVGNKDRLPEVSNIALDANESKELRKLKLHALHLVNCMMTTDLGLPNENFSSHSYSSSKLLEDLEDRQKVVQ